jgi:hypothetical protein
MIHSAPGQHGRRTDRAVGMKSAIRLVSSRTRGAMRCKRPGYWLEAEASYRGQSVQATLEKRPSVELHHTRLSIVFWPLARPSS